MEEQPRLQWSKPYNYPNVGSIDTGRDHQWRYSPDFLNVIQYPLQLTGSRYNDCVAANQRNNQSHLNGSSPDNFTWHHCYNLNMSHTGDYMMQLPARDLHRKCCPHEGAFNQGKEMGFYSGAGLKENTEVKTEKAVLKAVSHQSSDIMWYIGKLEDKMQRCLPLSLIEFYLKNAPGTPEKTILYRNKQDTYGISWFNEIIEGSNSIFQILNFERYMRNTWKEGLLFSQKSHIPFAEDAFGNIYFLYMEDITRRFSDAPVYFYNHEEDTAIQITDNFNDFQTGWFTMN